jgi:hypothetical protein
MAAARPFDRWVLRPPTPPGRRLVQLWEVPTGHSLLERLRAEAELEEIGRSRFSGTLKQRNAMWRTYRNFLRQAIANFHASLGVENRSSSLLTYYAMLNFAKAELLTQGAPVAGFIQHGLRFNVTRAKTIEGDTLTVETGVFPALYQARTGQAIRVGTRLPIRRLLAQVPEVNEQIGTVNVARGQVRGLLQLVASDSSSAWTVLALNTRGDLETATATGRYWRRFFHQVDPTVEWRDRFAVSRRWGGMDFYESNATVPYAPASDQERHEAMLKAADLTWSIRDVLGFAPVGMWDAWLAPSLYRTKMLPMPPALARYALTFYASSLVRYRPSMFDTQVSPDQAYLFDALAREAAIPMLLDTLTALTRTDYQFWAQEELRT